MAQEATSNEVANRKLRRLLAYSESFKCTDVQIGGTAFFFDAMNRKSTPRWGAPTEISGNDETAVAVKFQSQTFTATRFCVGEKAEEEEVDEVEWSPPRIRPRFMGWAPWGSIGLRNEGTEMGVGDVKVDTVSSVGAP